VVAISYHGTDNPGNPAGRWTHQTMMYFSKVVLTGSVEDIPDIMVRWNTPADLRPFADVTYTVYRSPVTLRNPTIGLNSTTTWSTNEQANNATLDNIISTPSWVRVAEMTMAQLNQNVTDNDAAAIGDNYRGQFRDFMRRQGQRIEFSSTGQSTFTTSGDTNLTTRQNIAYKIEIRNGSGNLLQEVIRVVNIEPWVTYSTLELYTSSIGNGQIRVYITSNGYARDFAHIRVFRRLANSTAMFESIGNFMTPQNLADLDDSWIGFADDLPATGNTFEYKAIAIHGSSGAQLPNRNDSNIDTGNR